MSLSKQLLHFAWQGPLNVCLGAFTIHLSELAGQTSPVLLRIPLLQLPVSSLQISLFLKLMVYACTAVTGFSKNVEKRLIFASLFPLLESVLSYWSNFKMTFVDPYRLEKWATCKKSLAQQENPHCTCPLQLEGTLFGPWLQEAPGCLKHPSWSTVLLYIYDLNFI